METSITSTTVSQQTICGDLDSLEIANNMEPKVKITQKMNKLTKHVFLYRVWQEQR